jgi:hypothetical protein
MNLSAAFEVERPSITVPWGISEHELLSILPAEPHHVSVGYYVIDCASLGGLQHALGFHFRPLEHGTLVELEFFRRAYPDLAASFDEFQQHLEDTFGAPTSRGEGDAGFPSYTWRVGSAWIMHYVFERFGPEEHVRMTHA